MRVALVQAPVFDPNTPSNALALLSAHLKRHGHEPRVHDASKDLSDAFARRLGADFRDARAFFPLPERHPDATERALDASADAILAGEPSVIGLSVLARTETYSLRLADKLKAKAPSCRVVFGGAQCLRENMAFEFARHPSVDAVALGEADLSFPAFLNAMTPGDAALPATPGMLVKRGEAVLDGGEPEAVAELDGLPYLDFSGFDLSRYDGDSLFLSTTRGCVRKCSFCTHIVGQKVYRTMSARRTVAEIRHQLGLYPRRNTVEFTDSLINGNVRRLGEMSDMLVDYRLERVAKNRGGNWDFGWTGMAIIHPTMTPALLRRMRHAGCVQLRYGFESASQRVLDSMQKKVDMRDAEAVIRDTHRAGIGVFLYTLVGFPTEHEEDFRMTLDFIERNAAYIDTVGTSACEVQKGSHLDAHPELYGLKLPLEDRLRWETADGANTYEVRQERMERMNRLIDRLSLRVQEFPTRLGVTLKAPEPEYDFYRPASARARASRPPAGRSAGSPASR
ncbi:MAG: radical SAM protein [Elusimicrobiota bacterium]|nr:radical SAM protein [Elusimicrobiota bacterium]